MFWNVIVTFSPLAALEEAGALAEAEAGVEAEADGEAAASLPLLPLLEEPQAAKLTARKPAIAVPATFLPVVIMFKSPLTWYSLIMLGGVIAYNAYT